MASVKGKLFERFVKELFTACGFTSIESEDPIIYQGAAGTMIHGQGQPHNADVLVEPPFQIPFLYPERLIIECKDYKDKIGLPVLRNVLGLREDVNRLEIITEEILENRKNQKSSGIQSYSSPGYQYQAAVASMEGFRSTAYSFAYSHRIPLFSFADSSIFKEIRECIREVEKYAIKDDYYSDKISEYLSSGQEAWYGNQDTDDSIKHFLKKYFELLETFKKRVKLAVLENGIIIFLFKAENVMEYTYHQQKAIPENECTLKRRNFKSEWELWDGNDLYYFELPWQIFEIWSDYVKKCSGRQKSFEDYFTRIILYRNCMNTNDKSEHISILHLSEENIREVSK